MTRHGWKWLIFPLAVLFLLAGADLPSAFAKGGGGGGGGRGGSFGGGGFKSSPSTTHFNPGPSKPSGTVFTRQGGGIHDYAKPGTLVSPGPAAPGGYPKPGTPVTGKPAPTAPAPGAYVKPGAPAAGVKPETGGYVKPTLKTVVPPGKPIGSAFDKDFSKKMQKERAGESLNQYKADQAKFKQPAKPAGDYKGSPIYQNAQTYGRFDYGNYSTRQTVYYRNVGWSPPTYVYMGSPNYGMWNFALWWMILDHHHDQQYSRMAYNQANDPGYRQWREDAEKRAEIKIFAKSSTSWTRK
jgi:hypothetical protein